MLKDAFPRAVIARVATMQLERRQVRADLIEAVAGARRTMTQSRALLAHADAILARGKLPLISPDILAWPVWGAEEI